ncbi:hypothetical protein Poli38472_000369 [Pythium oligandrum]|uniref:Uncharacterized protein n=1 Tax=Pythium oligandrum TaxID=41045 RepID=A0A8K1CDL0_PYTOL|nr:hypothetical protein Poli38472_000369 [Pythium oligandrum]|eukprot:TMW60327.1 hypothetical protein Poli38472_000369 [Pythium oligandrum]
MEQTTRDLSAVSLALRGEKLAYRNAVASCYNRVRHQLLVASAPLLSLYGDLLELGGVVVGTLTGEENTQFQFVMHLPWLDAYSVIATDIDGNVHHRVVSWNLKMSWMSHTVAEKAAFYAGIVNGSRKEIITSDSTGGFRVWALRFTPSSGYKGFLRVHAGNRKSHYRYLFLTRNEEVILACTPSRIQAFDATTCARITTLYRSTTGSIAHVGWDDESDALHLSLSNQPRQVLKYTLASNRGRQLVLNSEAKACANEDIAVFTTANVDQSALKAETVNFDGIFFVDDCGNFTVSANRSLEVDGDSSNQQAPTISLQLSPSTEHYLELHTLSSAQYRTFVVAVCSSGIYVIETFLPGSITRRVITNVPGTSLKATQHGEWRRIAVHCAEPPSLLLLDSEEDQFCAMVLQPPGVTDSSSTSGQPKLPSLVDYAAFPDAIVMAWSNGLVSRYSLTTGRTQAMFCVKNPTTLVVLRISVGNQLIVVGDEDGVIAVWSVAVDREQKEISTHEVCSGRVAAILNICMAKTVEAAISLISLSSGGDVKMWSMQFGQAAVQWTLLACFHTYASSLSASALLSPGYVFCGSEEGGFECWKVPDASAIMATSTLHPSHRAVVVKRPVHSLDVHLSRICQIVVEPGDAGKRMTEAPVYLDEFTWIVTYDSDAIALIWCMSPSFLYPHRRIKLHGNPLGSYLTLHDSTALRFYAYLGRCLECVDILTEGDKISSKDRLRRGREKSSEVQYQDHVRYDISGQRQSNNIDVAQTSEYSSSENCSPALRIRITVPTIDYAYFAPDGEHADSSSAEMGGREHAIEDAVVDESDVERNAIELELMTIEDALSRELGNTGVDSESEDEHEEVERHIEPPKRTDFTRSYFFGNLPSSVRLTSDGWAAGSGVDNGDEEIEEEERLERERKHQEMLDRQEAERLAELERLAEQARLEKEKEEKALQLRRLRLAELKKVLAHQAELEAARIEQLEREIPV